VKKAGSLSIYTFAIILFFASGIAEGANWGLVSEYDDMNIYVDNESIKHLSETVVGAQFKIVYKEPTWVKSKSIDYYLIEQENNCSEKRYKIYQVKVYFTDGTNDTFTKKEEHDVNPDTFQYVIHEFICKQTK
jgi:Surface-adhesin protein E